VFEDAQKKKNTKSESGGAGGVNKKSGEGKEGTRRARWGQEAGKKKENKNRKVKGKEFGPPELE